jgi:hypothetical protein
VTAITGNNEVINIRRKVLSMIYIPVGPGWATNLPELGTMLTFVRSGASNYRRSATPGWMFAKWEVGSFEWCTRKKVQMKRILIHIGLMAVMCIGAAAQAATDASWIGVWKGELNGLPSLTVVVADNGGPLGGTVVLYQVKGGFRGDTPQILTQEPHVMIGPEINGNVLTFRVRTSKEGQELTFRMTLSADAKAHLNCESCRATIELAREPLPKN